MHKKDAKPIGDALEAMAEGERRCAAVWCGVVWRGVPWRGVVFTVLLDAVLVGAGLRCDPPLRCAAPRRLEAGRRRPSQPPPLTCGPRSCPLCS
jgi:hypothetical protein